MSIAVQEPSAGTYDPFYMLLEAVQYFEGPMWWDGIDFRLGSTQEWIDLLHWNLPGSVTTLDEITFPYFLLILERPSYRVRILAGSCDLTKSAPEIYFNPPDLAE